MLGADGRVDSLGIEHQNYINQFNGFLQNIKKRICLYTANPGRSVPHIFQFGTLRFSDVFLNFKFLFLNLTYKCT